MFQNRTFAIVALIGAVLCWTGNFLVGGIVAQSMDIVSLMYIKWSTAVIPLLVLAHILEKPDWKALLKRWPILITLSVLGIAGYSFMFYQSLKTSSAINASLINAFNPILILLGAAVFLKQKITFRSIAGIAVALFGVLWVTTAGRLDLLFEQSFKVGDLWMLAVITAWAAYTLIIRAADEMPALASSGLQILFFTIAMTPVAIVKGIHLPAAGAPAWAMTYIAIFPSVVAYALWNVGARVIEPGAAGQYLNLVLPFAAIATLLMGKGISTPEIIGGVLILVGVVLSTKRAPAERARETASA